MKQHVYLNGHIVPQSEARIPVADRGFRFGDGVFETIAVYNRVPYQWDLHMERLKAGLHALDIPADVTPLQGAAHALISINELNDATLRIAISRGVGSQGYLPTGGANPTVVMETADRITPPATPESLWVSKWEKPSPKALPVEYKLAQGVNSSLARMEAAGHGCLDSILCNARGEICETSSANLFWKKGDMLYTPALECGLLAGTTRAAILRLSPYAIEEGAYVLDTLADADALVVTNTHWQAMPIVEIKPNGWNFAESEALADALRNVLANDIAS